MREELRAGTPPGGVQDVKEIKLIICYLMNFCREPLTREQIFDILDFNRIVNYFYFAGAFEELVRAGQISREGDGYVLGAEGKESALILQDKISKNVREKLEISAKNYVNKVIFEKWHNIDVKKEENGFTIRCTIRDDTNELMSVSLFVPEVKQISRIKENFGKNSEEIYRQIVLLLSGETFD